jgi:hypothetical protein
VRVDAPAVLPALLAATLLGGVVAAQEPREPEPGEGAAEAKATSGPVSVVATASKNEVTVGETFTIELKAMGPPGTAYRFASGASEEEIELRTPEPEEFPAGEGAPTPEPGTHRYEAAVFALGEVEIPPIPVRFRLADGTEGEAASEPILLKVASLLPRDADQQKLSDIRGPQSVGIGHAFWAAVIAGVLLLAGLATWLVGRRKKTVVPDAPPVPETPPDVEALTALRALASAGLLEARAFREFYIRLTTIAKRYLERRLEAPVLEMTTSETTAFLRGHPHGGELLPVVRELAQAADQIKFARGQGLAEAAEGHLAAVRALVPALEARLRPAETQSPGEGKAA